VVNKAWEWVKMIHRKATINTGKGVNI